MLADSGVCVNQGDRGIARASATLPGHLRYVVVEGPIGVGKTTLAHRLAERVGAGILLEDPGANPFLPAFYREPARYALHTQLSFLLQRANQVRALAQSDLFATTTVADFMLAKDPLFAALNLEPDELRLYSEVYRHLQLAAPAPDLVIYLQAPAATLLERVRRRGRDYESTMAIDYLARLAVRYAEFFRDYTAAPLIVVDAENLNFVDRENDFDLLLSQICAMNGARVHLGPRF
jgi:deoxyguanosine kinase